MTMKTTTKTPEPTSSASSKMKVEHDYHDYSHVTEDGQLMKEFHEANANVIGPHKGEQNFPVKLHYMLSELEADGLDYIVSWQPHGRCFLVHDQHRFVEEILPLWFRQSKFASFQRQLNLYGFKRLTSGRDKGGYYHECFLRGKRFLAYRIERIKIKGTGARKPGSPETEPNFYLTPFLPHVPREPVKNGNSSTGAVGAIGAHNNTETNNASASNTVGKFTTASPFVTAASSLGLGSLGGSLGVPFHGLGNTNDPTTAAIQRYLLSASLGEPAMSAHNAATQLAATPSSSALLLEAQTAQLASSLLAGHQQQAQQQQRSSELLALQSLCSQHPALLSAVTPSANTTLQSASSAIVAALLQQREGAASGTQVLPNNMGAATINNSNNVDASARGSSGFGDWLLSLQQQQQQNLHHTNSGAKFNI